MSILDRKVSYYPNITAPGRGVVVSLLSLLQSDKHKSIIIKLRQSSGSLQVKLKDALPCFTPTGVFSYRRDDCLVQPSGLCAVDLDSAQDYDIQYLLWELRLIDSIAYAGMSCRGKRLFCIVPFKYPDKYLQQYDALIKAFDRIGLPMGDFCHKRISQPRFVSWNDNSTQFYKHNARPFHILDAEKSYHFISATYSKPFSAGPPANAFQWCVDQINKRHSFIKGKRHEYIVQLCRYCNIKGLSEQSTMNGCLTFASDEFPETEIKKIVRNIYTRHADSHAKLPFLKIINHK